MHKRSDICIIGNGVIGKTAALMLAQSGMKVILLQAAAPLSGKRNGEWDLRVYALNHEAREALTAARVWDALDGSRIAAVDAMDVRGTGSPEGRIGFDAYAARVDALAWIVEDANLNEALDAALKFSPVERVTGRASALTTTETHAAVVFDGGMRIEASLLIGADGANSWVRGQCDIGIDYRSYGQRAVVANFECARPHRHVARQWFAENQGIVALLPLPGQRVSLVWSAPDALADTLMTATPDELARRVSEFCSGEIGELHPLGEGVAGCFPLTLVRPHAIVSERIALIGDAAHVVHPLAGHGMNLGFGDVAALTRLIAGRESHRDCGDRRVLSRYARERKEDILLMQAATDGLERFFGIDAAPVRMARNLGLSMIDRLPFIKRRLIAHAIGKHV